VVALVVAVAFAPAGSAADAPKKAEAKTAIKLVGTWKLVTAKYNGQDFTLPEGHTTHKHVTPSHFMWATFDPEGKVTLSLGGSCTVKGNKYEETPEYGVGNLLETLKGKVQTFEWKVEGNKWYHTGRLSTGLTIEEVWERVEKK